MTEGAAVIVIVGVLAYWLGHARALGKSDHEAKAREFRLKRVSQAEGWRD